MTDLTFRTFRSFALDFFGRRVYFSDYDNPVAHNFSHLSYRSGELNALGKEDKTYAEKPLNNPFYDTIIGCFIIGGLCLRPKNGEMVYTRRILSRVKAVTAVSKNNPNHSASFHLNCSFSALRTFSKKHDLKYRIFIPDFDILNEEEREILAKNQEIYEFDEYWDRVNELVRAGIFASIYTKRGLGENVQQQTTRFSRQKRSCPGHRQVDK